MIIVCFGSEPWDGLKQRHQHLMSGMARDGHRIVYVDPTNLLPMLKGSMRLPRRLQQVDDNVAVVRPLFLPWHYRSGLLEALDRRGTARLVNEALKGFGAVKPDVVWTYSPYFNFMLDEWPGSLLVYDCVDACDGVFSDASSGEPIRKWILEREGMLLERSDIVLAVSRGLMKRCAHHSGNVHLVENGTPSFPSGGEEPPDLKAIRGPRIGYVGRLGDWFDYDLIDHLADARPQYSIVLVGPLDTKGERVQRLAERSNVRFMGPRDFREVSGYIRNFDVCMIPFTVQPLTSLANPVKLFEYSYFGKPIVSTPLDGVLEFSDLVYASDGSKEDFATKVDLALAEPDAELPEMRRAMAKEHQWDAIVAKVETLLIEAAVASEARRSDSLTVPPSRP